MPALSIPSERWQYVNKVTSGAFGQYSQILGSTNAVNENPLAVQSLLDYCNSHSKTGVIMYGIDGAPFYSGGTTLTAAGIAKLRDFVSRASAQNLDVAVVWGGSTTGNGNLPTNFATAMKNYNAAVNANEKIIVLFTEYEFWNANTKNVLLNGIISNNAVKAALHAEGIDVYWYLGYTHLAGYQYPGDSTPITVDEVTQLTGVGDALLFHNYFHQPEWAVINDRAYQVTASQRTGMIFSDETPDNNASGGYDPTGSFFEGIFRQGRNSASPYTGTPGNPPPVLYSEKSDVNVWQYVFVPGAYLPPQAGSPLNYAVDPDTNAQNNCQFEILACFSYSWTVDLMLAATAPPPPISPPSGLIPWGDLNPHACVLLLDILYVLLSSPMAPINPQPTDYDLSSQECILLYDILITLIAGGGGGGTITIPVIDITIADALQADIDNTWLSGRTYRITDPPLPMKTFIAQALPNVASGQIRLGNVGTCELYNFDGTTYPDKCFALFNFNDTSSFLITTTKNFTVVCHDSGGANFATLFHFNSCSNSTINSSIASNTSGFTDGLEWNNVFINNAAIDFGGFTEPVWNGVKATDLIFTVSGNGTQINNSNLGISCLMLLPAPTINNLILGYNSWIDNFLYIDSVVIGNTSTVAEQPASNLLSITNCIVGDNKIIECHENQNCAVYLNQNSSFKFTLDLSDSTYYDPLGRLIQNVPNGCGLINLVGTSISANSQVKHWTVNPSSVIVSLMEQLTVYSSDTDPTHFVEFLDVPSPAPDDIIAAQAPILTDSAKLLTPYRDRVILQLSFDGLNYIISPQGYQTQ